MFVMGRFIRLRIRRMGIGCKFEDWKCVEREVC